MRTSLLVVCIFTFLCTVALADEPTQPPFAWQLIDTFPADGSADAPLNGVTAVRMQYGLSSQWPDQDTVLQTVSLRLTRGEDEAVPGEVDVVPFIEEVRFATEFPLDEGVEYTLRIDLLNSAIEPGSEDISETVRFTTGNRFDEAPPAFSGLQSLGVTEESEPVLTCCPGSQTYCELQQEEDCSWCWVTDYQYSPLAELMFRSVEDEFGADTIAYLVYELEGVDGVADEPWIVVRYSSAEDRTLRTLPQRQAPWCYFIQSVDIWGQMDANNSVLCATADDLIPIERLEIPAEDRSMCADNMMGADAGVPDASSAPDIGSDSNQADVETPNADAPAEDGCTCQTSRGTRSIWRWLQKR